MLRNQTTRARPAQGRDLRQPPVNEDLAMMEACDCAIANLTPFRGALANAGTLVELGWFLGRGRPVFGYSNSALPVAERSRRQVATVPILCRASPSRASGPLTI
jgi:nucleoside 2-deoxyribosyltransferase